MGDRGNIIVKEDMKVKLVDYILAKNPVKVVAV